MPKIKTHSASKKRFKITATGKVKRFKAGKSHILNHKSSKRLRGLRHSTTADTTNEATIKKLIPYM